MAEIQTQILFDSQLNTSIFNHEWEIVNSILDNNKEEINRPYRINGSLCIHFAAQAGNVELVKRLKNMGISLSECNKDGLSCLFWAVAGYDRLQKKTLCIEYSKQHREEMIEYLVKNDAPFDRRVLQRALICGDTPVVELLLKLGCPTEFYTPNFWSAIFDTIRLNMPDVCDLFCKYNADKECISYRCSTPLQFAAMLHSFDCIQVLAKHGADLEPIHTSNFLTPVQELRKIITPEALRTVDFLESLILERKIKQSNYQKESCEKLAEIAPTLPTDIIYLACSYLPLYIYK